MHGVLQQERGRHRPDTARHGSQRCGLLGDGAGIHVTDQAAVLDGVGAHVDHHGPGPDVLGGDQPGPSGRSVLTWQYGTGDSVSAVTIRRAMWYSVAASWYWWYDSGWKDVDGAAW